MQVPPLTPQQMEDRAAAFNARYGIKASWSDKKIDRALKDHGLPTLDSMPDHGVGTLGVMSGRYGPYGGEDDKTAHRRWQRTNAMHRLGHIALEHPAEAIESCASCGGDDPVRAGELTTCCRRYRGGSDGGEATVSDCQLPPA